MAAAARAAPRPWRAALLLSYSFHLLLPFSFLFSVPLPLFHPFFSGCCSGRSRAKCPSINEAKVKRDTTAIISHFQCKPNKFNMQGISRPSKKGGQEIERQGKIGGGESPGQDLEPEKER